ncbi:uncharacterized protein LOC129608631 [Condylostylus longicornis]|uniref:uncharacterized protein LOC129608631 n=1 Tax=Condylostylus longicornis TaxID=2530218 RepID=UPI00244E47E3|nr:uncharacterized protein LOC129608631 [Condylostylus longicornis]
MAKLLIVISALLCLQLAACNVVRRDAPATNTLTFAELAEKAQTGLKEANDEFLKFFGFENNDQVVAKIKSETQKLATTVQQQFEELQKHVNSEQNQEIISSIKDQINNLTSNVDIGNDAKAVNEQFQTSLQKLAKETQKLGQKLQVEGKEITQDTEKLFKTIYDSTLDAAKKVGEVAKKHS